MTNLTKIHQYYVHIVMNKPNFIEVKNSYERYCVYMALEQYATDWQTVWFNKSYKKEAKYATHNICKYCFRKKKHYHNVEEWEHEDMERDFCYYYYKCNNCNDIYAEVWEKGDFMFLEKIPYKINIYYSFKKKMRSFKSK